MNGRAFAGEIAALAARTLWVYSGTALAVSAFEGGASVSMGAAAAVVVLSYGLARLLQRTDLAEQSVRLWGTVLSLGLLYLILRMDIAGEPYLWRLDWLVDLFAHPGGSAEAGNVVEVVLLAGAWMLGIARGTGDSSFDNLLGDVSLGLLVVGLAAVVGPAAGAPEVVSWLPVPYMVAGLLALALAHLSSVEPSFRGRTFLGAWALWTGGLLAVISGLAMLAGTTDWPSLRAVGSALSLAVLGLALAVGYAVAPLLIALEWVMEHLRDGLSSGEQQVNPRPIDTGQPSGRPEGTEPGGLSQALGYVLRSGALVLAIAAGLTVLWSVFRRFSRRSARGEEVREEVEGGEGGPLRGLRSLLSAALGRLRRAADGGPRGRDAIGRLYISMLRRAAAQGLPRPAAATALEFAPRLEEHFRSPLPGAISQAYAEARYGRRPRPREEIMDLRARWREVARAG